MSVSSLLKSAQSTRQRIIELENSYVDFQWDISAKTYDDVIAYRNHYESRLGTTNDPSKQLTYTRKLYSANRSFRTAEIQRMNIEISEGRGTLYEKQDRLFDLYGMAVANDDMSLAQSIRAQIGSLDIQIQNMEQQAQRVAGTMANNQVKSLDELKKKFMGDEFLMLGDGTVVKGIGAINNELKQSKTTGLGSYFADAAVTLNAYRDSIITAYQSATTQEAADTILNKYGDVLNGTGKIDTVAGKLSMNEVMLALRAEQANNPLYRLSSKTVQKPVYDPATGKTTVATEVEYSLERNKTDEFVWIRNDQGQYEIMPIATEGKPTGSLDMRLTDDGYVVQMSKNNKGLLGDGRIIDTTTTSKLSDRLASLGIQVGGTNSDGTVSLIIPGLGQVNATITNTGQIRYIGESGDYGSGVYEINPLQTSLDKAVREVAPDEASIFGDRYSRATSQGTSIMQQFAGLSPRPTRLNPNAKINVLSETDVRYGLLNWQRAVGFGSGTVTGGMLQGATVRRMEVAEQERTRKAQEAAQELQRTMAAERLQQVAIQNLNQTLVSQASSVDTPIQQIRVAPLPQQPTLSVQPVPKQTATVTAPKSTSTVKVDTSSQFQNVKLQVR